MDRTYVQRLIDERNQIWERAKEILDAAAAEDRDLTTEEQTNIDATNADLDARDAQIKEMEALSARGKIADETRVLLESQENSRLTGDTRALFEVASGVRKFADFSPPSWWGQRSLETNTDLVAQSFYAQVQVYQRTLNPTYDLATVIQTRTGENLFVPRLTSDPTTYTPGQGTAITASDPTMDSITLSAFGYKTLTAWSNELDVDNAVNLQGLVAESAGRSIGLAAGAHFTTGTGTTMPTGFIAGGTNGGTAAGTPYFDSDDLITLYYGVAQPYRMAPTAAWQMSNSAIAKARKFKTSTTNEYLWQPGMTIGSPDALMGKPVYENPTMATVASASKSVAFGDFKRYMVREVVPMRVAASQDYAFNLDTTNLRIVWRVDGNLPLSGAISYLVSYDS